MHLIKLFFYNFVVYMRFFSLIHFLSALLCVSVVNAVTPVRESVATTSDARSKRSVPIRSASAVAIVGKKIITQKDLQDRIDLILVTSHSPVTNENRASIREQVLKNMIEELVQVQVAEKYKVAAKDKDVMNSIDHIAKENGGSLKQLEDSLKQHGVPLSSLKERIRAQLSWNNFIRGAYSHTVHITDKDVEKYLSDLKADEQKEQFEVYEIFLRSDKGDIESVKRQADNLVGKIRSGANFRIIAQQFSQSPSASRGGYLGWVNATQEGSQTYTNLQVGQVSAPVKTNHGYYIYYLADKKLPGQSQQGGDLISYKQVLIPVTEGLSPESDPYLAAHVNELMETMSLAEFEKTAKERNLQLQTVKDRPFNQIQKEHQAFFNTLTTGKPSQPVLTPDGMVIIIVTGKRRADPPKPPSKEEAKDILESQRLALISSRDLAKQIGAMYISLPSKSEFPNLNYGSSGTADKAIAG